jgi:hypothetical protein
MPWAQCRLSVATDVMWNGAFQQVESAADFERLKSKVKICRLRGRNKLHGVFCGRDGARGA